MKEPFVVNDATGRGWRAYPITCPACGEDSYRELFKLVKSRCDPRRPTDTFVKCCNCGLVYINPRILFPLEPVRESPERSPSDVDLNANRRLSDYELPEDLERIRKFKPTGHLLEIGCGTGTFLSLASEVGYQATGIEPVVEHAAYARDRLGLKVIQGLVGDPRQSIELPADAFDVVVMIAVLEHVLDVSKVVQAVQRSLRHGGILYLTTPDVNSVFARLRGSRWNMYHVCWHHQFFSEYTLRRLLTEKGFQVLKKWGVYRGRPIRLKRIIKKILATVRVSLDVMAVLAEKIK